MWDFFKIRKKAIKVLLDSNMGMMLKTVIGWKYKVTAAQRVQQFGQTGRKLRHWGGRQ